MRGREAGGGIGFVNDNRVLCEGTWIFDAEHVVDDRAGAKTTLLSGGVKGDKESCEAGELHTKVRFEVNDRGRHTLTRHMRALQSSRLIGGYTPLCLFQGQEMAHRSAMRPKPC